MDPKKRGRGPGKRPAMFNTSIRIPQYVADYFDTHYPYTKQAVMRAVLINFIEGAKNGEERINGGTDSQGVGKEPE